MNPKELDILNCPISGTVMVEASAGTGKTYSLSSLFLRLLFERGLHVSEILVVTFTNLATEELRDRIRHKLRLALKAFDNALKTDLGPYSEDQFLDSLCRRWGPEKIQDALEITQDAIRDFDQASIYTIHGFCHRVLYENAFETGQLFDSSLLTFEEELRMEVILDFYRTRLYTMPVELARVLGQELTHEVLLKILFHRYHHPELEIIPSPQALKIPDTSRLRALFTELRKRWPQEREEARKLLISWPLNAAVYKRKNSPDRVQKVDQIIKSMDLALWPPWPLPPLPREIEKLSRSYILSKVNKGHQIDPSEIFELCQELWDAGKEVEGEILKLVPLLKAEFINFAVPRLNAIKQRRNVRTFSDLIEAVDRALRGPGGTLLKASVTSRYKAALIDEFQDTDPLQYRIFKTLFDSKQRPLFLIGDPKQSIYRFRGAEIFTYLQAAREVKSQFTLTQNHRSHKGLVRAVNRIFSLQPEPFVFKEIRFAPGTASKKAENRKLQIEGKPTPPMKIWLIGEGYKNKGKLVELISQKVASEIQRLLLLGEKGQATIEGKPVKSSDFAVLVKTNFQALAVQERLASIGIHSVVYGGQSVWSTAEAKELERLLWAVAAPEDEGLLRGALATTIVGATADQLHDFFIGQGSPGIQADKWEKILERFRGYRALWQEQGFVAMMQRLISREGIRARLLSLPQGERRMTNLLHLVELIQQGAAQRKMGISGLLRWMGDQIRGGSMESDATLLRLESDEEAVRILTIYKSKGLEFPIVFCPFAWDSRDPEQPLLFHPQGDEKVCLDLGSPEIGLHAQKARKEVLSEELRLLYVALTRAKSCCYLVICPDKLSGLSAPNYLFSPANQDPVNPNFEEFRKAIEHLLASREFDFTIPPQGLVSPEKDPDQLEQKLQCRVFKGAITKDWAITSFSALAGRKGAPELPGYDSVSTYGLEPIPWAEKSEEKQSFLYFPRGGRAGSFIHKVLEELDFSSIGPGAVKDMVEKRLEAFGFEREWEEAVSRMLEDLASTPLDPACPGLTLSQIGMDERLNELEFFFPLKKTDPQTLAHMLGLGSSKIEEKAEQGPIGRLTFSPVKGFMKGFIDMVFRWKGRFFLVDWKSNYLGPLPEDYGQESLREVMVSELYVLQYHIYALALHQYLKARIRDYDYSTHFGGVYYVFLRGINKDWGPGAGIFRDRPDKALMEEMARAMIDCST